jgi:hypothetical protein
MTEHSFKVDKVITYSVHSFNAVHNLFTVCEFSSSASAADDDTSLISLNAATAFATTYKHYVMLNLGTKD